jgi:predicted nucleotidyltransferase
LSNSFNKTNLDTYFKELGKEFRKLNGKKIPAEIILIDGASILINYGFRETTNDVDAIIIASSAMKQAINNVGDRLDLPNNWLNKDFEQTDSYSSKLI